ncbi:MAG TPA: fused MFS/spermidine synthase [Candidatus Krumholzibacterium sp.]|nr:fused MFS/spermidine synthase [Candidatus Krumholzibacterium sp.]
MGENAPGARTCHWCLYLIVSISGAAVLAVEILGTRILGPFYGVNLFLWSALITVTLSALSAGYVLGGRLADGKASMSRLAVILAVAGIWLILIPLMKGTVLWIAEPLGLRMAVIVAATVLFFPPLGALGMVSPFAIKLRTVTLNEVGRSAGNLYAVSTFASVAAALLTGFVLIPNIAVSHLITATGALLLATGAFAAVIEKNRSAVTNVLTIILIVLAAGAPFVTVSTGRTTGDDAIIAFEQSPYAQIAVVDHLGARFLLIDGSIHTFIDGKSGETLFPYVNVIDIAGSIHERPGEALLVGLGGGSVAKRFKRAGWSVDAVEIDPVVVGFARDYFGLRESDARVFTVDGRQFLQKKENSETSTDRTYDLVIMDAFGSGSVPFHLVTKEAFGALKGRLGPEGIVAMNIQSIGWKSRLVRSISATLLENFSEVLVLPIVEPPNRLGNVIILASDRPLEIEGGMPDPDSRYSGDYDRYHAWNNRFTPDTDGMPVLTDDLNPVDLWTEQVSLVERKGLHEYFRDIDLPW